LYNDSIIAELSNVTKSVNKTNVTTTASDGARISQNITHYEKSLQQFVCSDGRLDD
jgi:hypothetical protein